MVGTGRKGVKFCSISLYFAIDMGQRGKNVYGKGQEAGVKNTRSRVKREGRRVVQTPLQYFGDKEC